MTPRQLIEPARLAGSVLRTQSDERLVDLVRDGNDRAFEAVVHRYRHQLLNYCGRFLSPPRAEDAVQQAFVNALGSLRSGDAEINLRPWLYRIAHNSALNVLRQTGADHEQVSEEIDGVETPPQAFERGERLRTVVAAVQDLPPRQRDALVLQALEGRSYDEIADELGVSDGAVRQLLNRARTTLRDGATALTPPALLARYGGMIDAPVAERVAQAVAGAGGGAVLAKGIAVAVVAAGTVVGGAVEGVIPLPGDRDGRPAGVTAADDRRSVAGGGASELFTGGRRAASTGARGSGASSRGSGGRARSGEHRSAGRRGGGRRRGEGGPANGVGSDGDESKRGRGRGRGGSGNSGHGGRSDERGASGRDDGGDRSGPGGGGDDTVVEVDEDRSGPSGDDSSSNSGPSEPDLLDELDDDNSGPGSGDDKHSGRSGPSGPDED